MRPLAFSLLSAFAASLLAQEPARDRIFGEVRGQDGKPMAGATVTLLYAAHAALTEAAYVDRVTATADERGRFAAQLLAGMPYVAWATLAAAAPTHRCTDFVDNVLAGVPVLLKEGDLHWQRRVRIDVDTSWTTPLRFHVGYRIGPFLVEEPLVLADGTAALPVLPAQRVSISACEAERLVFSRSVPITLPGLRATKRAADAKAPVPEDAALRAELAAEAKVTIGPRTEHSIRFVDSAGKAVAGVRVFGQSQEPREDYGTSAADGILRVLRAGDGSLGYESFASAPAHAEARVEREQFASASDPPRDCKLEPGRTVRGRLMWDERTPAAGVPLLLEGSIRTGDNSTYFGVSARLHRTGAGGAFALPGRVSTHEFYVLAVLTPAQRMRWMAEDGAAPVAPTALVLPPANGNRDDLGDVRLDQLVPVRLRVLDRDGGQPGPTTVVAIPAPLARDGNAVHWPWRTRTDRRGRVCLLAPKDTALAVFALTKAGVAWTVITAGAEVPELRLDAGHVVRLRITDAEQKPFAKASVDVVGIPYGKLQGEMAQLQRAVNEVYCVHGFPWKRGSTDADGCVELVMPFRDCPYDVVVYRTEPRAYMRFELAWPAVADGKPIEVTFVPNNR